MNAPPTRLDKLELANFRCFSKIEIRLHEKLTVIVAVNGGGKTTVLDAACFGWQFFLQGIELEQSAKTIREADVRVFNLNCGRLRGDRQKAVKRYLDRSSGILEALMDFEENDRQAFIDEEIEATKWEPFWTTIRHSFEKLHA